MCKECEAECAKGGKLRAIRLTTVEHGAQILGVSDGRLYEMVRTGLLPPGVAVHLGRQIRIDEDALTDWIKAGGQALPGGWKRVPDEPASPAFGTPAMPENGTATAMRQRAGRRHG